MQNFGRDLCTWVLSGTLSSPSRKAASDPDAIRRLSTFDTCHSPRVRTLLFSSAAARSLKSGHLTRLPRGRGRGRLSTPCSTSLRRDAARPREWTKRAATMATSRRLVARASSVPRPAARERGAARSLTMSFDQQQTDEAPTPARVMMAPKNHGVPSGKRPTNAKPTIPLPCWIAPIIADAAPVRVSTVEGAPAIALARMKTVRRRTRSSGRFATGCRARCSDHNAEPQLAGVAGS